MKTLKDRLIYARTLSGLTQGELADKAKCAQSAIGNAESGERKSLRNLVLVARALKVSADWLFDGKGPIPTKHAAATESHVITMFANSPTLSSQLQTHDQHTIAAIEIMQKLMPSQREGALAALKTHVSHLGTQDDGQALSVAGQ